MAATSKAPPATLPANQSIYIKNLPEKINKNDLKRELYMLFSTYGPVLDVTTLRTAKMRGQAHVLFRDIHNATQAMRACQNMEFFGREMKITYSTNRSNTLSKLTGVTNVPAQDAKSTTDAAKPVGSLLPPPPSNLPPKIGELKAPPPVNAPSPGQKRPREESDDEDESAPMEEDDDEEEDMDMSD